MNQLVYHGREELARVWEDRFQGEYGVQRDEVLGTLDEYLNCGILAHGAAITVSTHCWWRFHVNAAEFVHHAARCMICLSPTKRAVKFAEHLHENVLEDVPNRYVVFTIPKHLRGYFRYDRKLNTVLFQAAWGSVAEAIRTLRTRWI